MPRDNNIISWPSARPQGGSDSPARPAITDLERRLRDDRPDLVAELRENARRYRPTIMDDWRDFISEVQASPYSHALVALAGLMAGLLLVILPALVAARLS